MHLDEPTPADARARSGVADQLPALAVDPDTLASVARMVGSVPAQPDPIRTTLLIADVGHPALAHAIAEFQQRYAAAAHSLAIESDGIVANLDETAASYRSAELTASTPLAELGTALQATKSLTQHSSTDNNRATTDGFAVVDATDDATDDNAPREI